MVLGARITSQWCFQRPLLSKSHRLYAKLTCSPSSASKVLHTINEECDDDFLLWLERKAGVEISSVLSIGKSVYGRSLFASEKLRTGDCILKVPFNVQISPDNLHPKIKSQLGDEIGNIAKLAIVILFEQKMGKDSEWAPYISRLPQPGEMHNTIFWSEDELDLIRQSSLYLETVNKKAQIKKEFLAIKQALESFPEVFNHIKLKDFMCAYALVESRAWRSMEGVSLIPLADFLNHDGLSEAIVLNDEDKQLSEVIADHDYAPKEEGFKNINGQSTAEFFIPYHNSGIHLINLSRFRSRLKYLITILYTKCSWNFCENIAYQVLKTPMASNLLRILLQSMGCMISVLMTSFSNRKVRSAGGKGKGLPLSLRAFARVLCCSSPHELCDLAMEAVKNDGRLARRPLRNGSQEILAHQLLLSQINQLTEEYNASIESLEPVTSLSMCKRLALRKQMARDLLIGELRVLKSASAWLENYCATLTLAVHHRR